MTTSLTESKLAPIFGAVGPLYDEHPTGALPTSLGVYVALVVIDGGELIRRGRRLQWNASGLDETYHPGSPILVFIRLVLDLSRRNSLQWRLLTRPSKIHRN